MQLQLLDFSRETLLVNLSGIFTLNITGVFACENSPRSQYVYSGMKTWFHILFTLRLSRFPDYVKRGAIMAS